MKKFLLLLVWLQFAAPGRADANPSLLALKNIDDFLTEIQAEESAAQEEAPAPEEMDQQSYDELLKWVAENPEEFDKMLASEGEPEEEDEESVPFEDSSAYCADPNDAAFLWDAKAKKKKKSGPKCTAAVLKTNISICCLLFVRTHVKLPANPASRHAKDFGSVLKRNGYCASNTPPRSAPVGAILVYSGGASGHIEIKRGENRYWWGPSSPVPATEWKTKKRYLKATYTKCGAKKAK